MNSLPQILYEDADIVVVNKPAGMASQPDRSLRPDMVNWLRNRGSAAGLNGKAGSADDIYVVHRLDLPVGGVMVYARNSKAAAGLSSQMREKAESGSRNTPAGSRGSHRKKTRKEKIFCRKMEKEYLAVLTGIPAGTIDGAEADDDNESGTDSVRRHHLEAWLSRAKGKNLSVVTDEKAADGDWCALDYEILARTVAGPDSEFPGQPLSLVRVQLLTGRRHQIRAMMAHVGAGVWGDKKYNPLFADRRGPFPLALQAVRLGFVHPATGKWMEFCLPPGETILERMQISKNLKMNERKEEIGRE